MYDSGFTLAALIAELADEVDIAGSIPDSAYIRWTNTFEQLVYTDLLGFFAVHGGVTLTNGGFLLSSLIPREGEDAVRFDDIVKIYGDGCELVRGGMISSVIFDGEKNLFWQDGDGVKLSSVMPLDNITVVRRIRPAIKTKTDAHIMLPYEWVDLLAAKLRGEAYKIANDDGQAAKWLADYNALLSSFTEWAERRQERYGE